MKARVVLGLGFAMIAAAALVGYTRLDVQVLWAAGGLLCH